MSFFDVSSARDMSRIHDSLHATIRSLPALVEEAEARVLREYTVQLRPSQTLPTNAVAVADRHSWTNVQHRTVVCLLGYDPIPAQCLDGLQDAVRDAVRKVLVHWVRQMKINPLERNRDAAGSAGSVSVEYQEWAGADLPPGWDAMLFSFDTRSDVLPNNTRPIVTSFG